MATSAAVAPVKGKAPAKGANLAAAAAAKPAKVVAQPAVASKVASKGNATPPSANGQVAHAPATKSTPPSSVKPNAATPTRAAAVTPVVAGEDDADDSGDDDAEGVEGIDKSKSKKAKKRQRKAAAKAEALKEGVRATLKTDFVVGIGQKVSKPKLRHMGGGLHVMDTVLGEGPEPAAGRIVKILYDTHPSLPLTATGFFFLSVLVVVAIGFLGFLGFR
jgi:hypothetical protein